MLEATLILFEDLDESLPMGRLLDTALCHPDIPRLEATLSRYAGDPSLSLFVYLHDLLAVELVGIEVGAGPVGTAVIHHLALSTDDSDERTGQEMVTALAEHLDLQELGAVVHGPEVPSFAACGFAITQIDTTGGQEQYQCHWVRK